MSPGLMVFEAVGLSLKQDPVWLLLVSHIMPSTVSCCACIRVYVTYVDGFNIWAATGIHVCLFTFLLAQICPLSIYSLCVIPTAEFLKKLAVWQNESYVVDGNTELIKSLRTCEDDLPARPP